MGAIAIILVFFVSLFAAGGAVGYDMGSRKVVAAVEEQVEVTRSTEDRILEWIVQRNPNATIRDFHGFPSALLNEAAEAGIDFRLLLATIDKESEFNPRAIGKAGEIGLMQVLPSTAAIIAKNKGWKYVPPRGANLGTLGDPKQNIKFGIAHLQYQIKKFGPTPAALRAYNRGAARALENRPHDRYAEDISFKLVAILHELPD